MNKIVTVAELNLAYTKIHELDKSSNLDKSLPALIWTSNHQLEFMFEPSMGRKGAWILSSHIEVLEDDYMLEEDNDNEY